MAEPDPDSRDVYSPPAAPLREKPRPWFRGFLLATLPSAVYFLIEKWLVRPAFPGLLALAIWSGVVVLTFYGVGVFLWSRERKPTWGRAVLAVVATGAWMKLVSIGVSIAMVLLGKIAR